MIVEKPSWLRHAGCHILSMDLQPIGERCATAGADHKVRIWSTKPLSKGGDVDATAPKLLATSNDHCGSVNCVRWSKSGLYLASGSDDNLVLIHEQRPGTATVEYGSNEPANIENWKVLSSLRGHEADVVDLAWSPDDSMLASCSLDNTVRIWQMPGGSLITVLKGHTSLVKGVAWDPIGSFVASQSDDKTVIIWQTSNWSPVHKAEGSWNKTVCSTFFRRLAWSPCGHFIITTHGFQKPRHTAQVLERGDWTAAFNFVGHNAPVVAVRVNHSMFRKQPLTVTAEGEELDTRKPKDELPYNVIAIGSQDCNVTVWSTANARPVFVGKHFFTGSVVDLTWSQDGYSLFCCSLDGTVATFHFEPAELGHIVPDKELEEIRKRRYGDSRGRQCALAESAAQLSIEAESKKVTTVKTTKGSAEAPAQSSAEVEAAAPSPPKPQLPPVRQKEYRQQDGRRRIIPEALPSDSSPAAETQKDDKVTKEVGEKRKLSMDHMKADVPSKRLAARATEVMVERGLPATASVAIDVTRASDYRTVDGVLSVQVRMPDEEAENLATPVCLEAKRRTETGETELICSQGGEIRWRDRFAGKVTALTGNMNFWAIGCEDGSLQVYSTAGRRAFPSMLVGSPAAFMDCHKEWELLLLTRGGTLHVWDLQQPACVLNESLLPLVSSASGASAKDNAGVMKIISARFSQAGAPLIVLANGHAFLFHMKMRTWLRVADDTFPSSSFVSTWPPAQASADGELATLQKGAALLGRTNFSWARALVNERYQTRAHLEDQMASALALNSPEEYRQSLVSYTRFLAKEADEVRLREICEDLLGPLHVPDQNEGASHWQPYLMAMKKRELLRNEVLPAMASNRAMQRLLNEYLDLLSEYDLVCHPSQQQQQSWPQEEPSKEQEVQHEEEQIHHQSREAEQAMELADEAPHQQREQQREQSQAMELADEAPQQQPEQQPEQLQEQEQEQEQEQDQKQ